MRPSRRVFACRHGSTRGRVVWAVSVAPEPRLPAAVGRVSWIARNGSDALVSMLGCRELISYTPCSVMSSSREVGVKTAAQAALSTERSVEPLRPRFSAEGYRHPVVELPLTARSASLTSH